MKSILMGLLLIGALSTLASAEGPKITETDSGFVVEYTGTPEIKKVDPSPNELNKIDQESLKREVRENISRLKSKIADMDQQRQLQSNTPPEDDIKISSIQAMETERSSNYVTYSIKADVDNRGNRGEVFIKLIGKNRDGHQIHFVYLNGNIDKRGSRTLTATAMLTLQQAMDVRSWEVDRVRKY